MARRKKIYQNYEKLIRSRPSNVNFRSRLLKKDKSFENPKYIPAAIDHFVKFHGYTFVGS